MQVCSPVIVDKDLKTFELQSYDIDIWEDVIPNPSLIKNAKKMK